MPKPRGLSTIYSGKVDLDKIIFFHEKEAWAGSYSGNEKRAKFHNDVVKLLKKIKESQDGDN